jgi:hypothetical protein
MDQIQNKAIIESIQVTPSEQVNIKIASAKRAYDFVSRNPETKKLIPLE